MKALLLLLAMIAVGCSPAEDEDKVTETQFKTGFTPSSSSSSDNESMEVPIYVGPREGSFGLANATNFSILLTGCQTGWTTTATGADPSLDVYKDDRDCLAKLLEFDWDGETYIPATDFTTWQIDDTAVFENDSDPTDTMEVRVVSTLENPIDDDEEITYMFYEIANGGTINVLEGDVGDPHALAVGGQSAPAFSIKSVAYLGTNVDGGGKFQFKMECDEDIDTTEVMGAITAADCAENSFADITYHLVEDTYGGAPDIDDAKAIFAVAGEEITFPTDVIDVGLETTVHGGFDTITLEGPDEMHNHPEMILILRVDGQNDDDLDNDSFTFYTVIVETLSYP